MSRRQKERAQRIAAYWQAKVDAARTPAARAQVEWDRLRALITAMPADQAARAWESVTGAVVTQRDVCTKFAPPQRANSLPNAQTRASAREGTRFFGHSGSRGK